MSTIGYAVTNPQGEPLAATVGPTRQSTQVNWLVSVAGFLLSAEWTPQSIERLFNDYAPRNGARLVRVRITIEETL